MRKSRTYGSVRGAASNGRPYRDRYTAGSEASGQPRRRQEWNARPQGGVTGADRSRRAAPFKPAGRGGGSRRTEPAGHIGGASEAEEGRFQEVIAG